MGWKGENYGDQLLKITLKDSAIIVAFFPYCTMHDTISGKHFAYEDVNGKPLSEKYVLRHQGQIAAVYFSGQKPGDKKVKRSVGVKGTGSYSTYSFIPNIHYREYIVCNEEMIAHWEYGTDEVKNEIKKEISFLDKLKLFASNNKLNEKNFYYNWNCWEEINENAMTIQGCYDYTIALPNDFYLLAPQKLQAISSTMAKALPVQGEAIFH
jgi:hypothetical protein